MFDWFAGGVLLWASMVVLAGTVSGQRAEISLSLPAGDHPGQPIVADVVGDDREDLIVESYFDDLRIYESTPSGLAGPSLLTLPPLTTFVKVADIDGDGANDIFGANFNEVVVAFNTGAGFSLQFLPIGSLTHGPAFVADFDGDGLADIMRGFEWIRQTAPGVFAPAVPMVLPGYTIPGASMYDEQGQFAVGDIDGDGDPDLVNEHVAAFGNMATLRSFLNDGSGNFSLQDSFSYWRMLFVSRPLLEDLDGDGRADLFVAELFLGAVTLMAYRGTATGSLLPWGTIGPVAAASDYRVLDFEGDGTKEFFWVTRVASGQAPQNVMARPDPTSAFSSLVGMPFGSVIASRLAGGDLLGDGLMDFAFIPSSSSPTQAQSPILIRPHAAFLSTPMTGQVDIGNGDFPVDVLSINGSAGGAYRRVNLGIGAPLTFEIMQPPSTAAPASFAVFGELGPTDNLSPFATAVGPFAIQPAPLVSSANTFVLADGIGVSSNAVLTAAPAPWSVMVSNGLPFPVTFTVQGAIQDDTSASGYSVTNAVVVHVD
jgi:VCBS repeat protein